MFGKVEICGINTAKLPVLTEEEKTKLLQNMKNGDEKSREELIGGNLRLVLSVVQKFSNRCENPDDLFQVGCIGLIKAVDNFDTEQNVRFSTYAVPMIEGEIKRYLRDNNMIRVSRSMRTLAFKALAAKEKLSSALGRDPTPEEIAEALNEYPAGDNITTSEQTEQKKILASEISEALEAIVTPASIYDPVYSDNGDSIDLYEQIADPGDGMDEWTENIALSQAMKTLPERERNILVMRFFKGKTQVEIAEEIGISQAQVSRLEKGAISKIKKQL